MIPSVGAFTSEIISPLSAFIICAKTSPGLLPDHTLRFLTRMGIIRYYSHSGYIASVLKESDLEPIMTEAAGIFIRKAECGQEVSRGMFWRRL